MPALKLPPGLYMEKAGVDLQGLSERLLVDTSEEQPTYLLIGSKGSYLKLSSSAYHLLRSVSSGISFDMLAAKLSQRQARQVTAAEVEAAYRLVIERIEEIEKKANQDPAGFWFRLPFIPARLVVLIGNYLSVLFHFKIALLSLCFILFGLGMLLSYHGLAFHFDSTTFWLGYVLFLVSLVFHELGHSTACVRYGAQPSDIGFAMYWIFPVFYSDVSDVWKLRRFQRVIVDIGGAFFQLIIGAGYALLYLISNWTPLWLACTMILYSCIFSLNPVLKFDGYWVVADALGVTNLGQQPRRILRYLADRVRGRSTKPLPWPTTIIGVLGVYTILSSVFWVYFVSIFFSQLWSILANYPATITAVINDILNHPLALLEGSLSALLISTFMIFIAGLMLLRVAQSLFLPLITTLFRRTQGV